jgi:catechol 2,3-dioxygenase-like lactoylglutathione lyase family enzyme
METSKSIAPLRSARLVAFAATTDAARCRAFYEGKLGLRVVAEDVYMLVLDCGGTWLKMQKGPELTPVPRTVVGWRVPDVEATVRDLAAAGVAVERYPWLEQREDGVAEFPDGSRVAWFLDPDGNILSVERASYDA